MKKLGFITLLILAMLTLAACGKEESNGNKPPSGAEDREKGKATEQQEIFNEVETIALETPFVRRNFSLEETGEILMWKEQGDPEKSNYASKVSVDGDIQDLEIDKYGNIALLPSGIIVTAHVDQDAPDDKKHTIIEYDPITGSEKTYLVEADLDAQLLHPGFGTYLEEPKTYVHTVTRPELGGEESFILDVGSNEVTEVTIVQDIIQEAGGEELASFPHFFLSEDASKIYASVLHLGAFVYDVDKKELDTLVLDDKLVEGSGNSTMLTADGNYFAYAINDDSAVIATFHAVNVETKETIEIGEGRKIFMLTDGNIILIDGENVNKFDMETKELTTIHTIVVEENQEIEDVTVSLDGNTIAYSYTEKEEDEKKGFIKVLSEK